MRGRLLLIVLVALVAALGGTISAAAQETDRVQVGLSGRSTTRGFSPGLYVTVTTLADFRRVSAGRWEGPVCDFTPNPRLSGPISVSWDVAFDADAQSAEDAARRVLTFEWPTIEAARTTVPHLVAGREVGAIPAFLVVTDSRGQTGYHESGLGFYLGRGVYVAVEFWSRGNALECTVRGVPVASWHRDTAGAALRQVRLEGNLPPRRVAARARGRVVSGSVADGFGHPVAGVTVRLERRVGRRWRAAGASRTSAAGTYSVRQRRPGTYRVVASLAGVAARSGPVRVR